MESVMHDRGEICETAEAQAEKTLCKLTALVRKHPKEDQELFLRMFAHAMETSDLEERQDAVDTMVEIIFDEKFKAEIGELSLPDLNEESHPKTRRLLNWTNHVAAQIRKLRETKGWTQSELAERADLMQSHVCRIEKSVHSPSNKTLVKIAKAFGVSVGEIDPDAD